MVIKVQNKWIFTNRTSTSTQVFSYNKYVGKEYLVYLHCVCAVCAGRCVNV